MTTDVPEAPLLRQLEEELLKPEVRRSPERVGRLLADEFIEFGSSGHAYDKAQVIEALREETPDPAGRLELAEFAARPLAPDVVLVTYHTVLRAGPGAPPESRLRSSIWKRIDGQWQMVFHQGTPSPCP
jgi:hypothetical protein